MIALWNDWKLIFENIEKCVSLEDANKLESSIITLYDKYNELKKANHMEFSNKNYTTYMHIVCHLPQMIRNFGKISIYNCQPIEEFNNEIKKQIGLNNNHFNTTNNCIKHFARNNMLLKYKRETKSIAKKSQEFRENLRKRTFNILKSNENVLPLNPLKILKR